MTGQISLKSLDIPQIHRFGIGFDKIINQLDEVLRINAQHNTNYPPYNLIRYDENRYAIEIAVAGFKQGEVSIVVKENELYVEGRRTTEPADEYVYRGISGRDFQRVFWLNDYVVIKDASQENGILTIHLERIMPEEKKPKNIPITYIV